MESSGAGIDERPQRRWTYEPAGPDGEGRLSYCDATQEESCASWSHISTKSIVAALSYPPLEDGEGRCQVVLYTEPNETNEDPQASRLRLESMMGTNLPSDFMDDFLKDPNTPLLQSHQTARKSGAEQIQVIVSTHSGTHQAENVYSKLVRPALWDVQPGWKPTKHLTKSETSVTEVVRNIILPKANSGRKTAMILLSGDGGLVDTLNALLSQPHGTKYVKPTIGLIPIGTGNAMAHSAGLSATDTLGLGAIYRGKPRPVPYFSATFSPGARLLANEARDELPLEGRDANGAPLAYGAVVCSWGLHASLVADSDTVEYRKHGAERFKMAANEALFPSDGSMPHPYRGKVSTLKVDSSGNETWEALSRETHGYVLATLVSQLEAGFTISPDSKPLDGKLRLVHFGAVSGKEAMEVMTAAYSGGKHVEDERVGYEEIAGLKIEFDEEDGRWRRVCIDGKIIKVEKGGWVELRMGKEDVVDLLVE